MCPPGLTLDTTGKEDQINKLLTFKKIKILYSFIFDTGTVCLDVREEKCYTDFKHGAGVNALDGIYPKCICCCSTIGKAWGGGIEGSLGRSETCPRRGTPGFTELCPKVSKYSLTSSIQLHKHIKPL